MTWRITYRDSSGWTQTATLDARFCEALRVDPDELRTPARAAWYLAQDLAAHGDDAAQLIRIEYASG